MSDEITVGGATYYRAGSGWRLRGARDVAVGPRFCALLDEIAALRAELAAALTDAERWEKLPPVVQASLVAWINMDVHGLSASMASDGYEDADLVLAIRAAVKREAAYRAATTRDDKEGAEG